MMTMSCLPAAASIEQRLDAAATPLQLFGRWPHVALFAAYNKRMTAPQPHVPKFIHVSTTSKEPSFLLRDYNRRCPRRAWVILAYILVSDPDRALARVQADLADLAYGRVTNRWISTADLGRVRQAIGRAAEGLANG